MKKTGLLHDAIREKWLELDSLDKFHDLEKEIVATLLLEQECTRSINQAEVQGNDPHPADLEFQKTSHDKAVELVKQYAELAMREDVDKMTRLSSVVVNKKVTAKPENIAASIIGKLLMDFLEANDRLPHSRSELRKSAKAEYKAMIDASKTGWTKLSSRGLEHYKLEILIQDTRGRKPN